MHNRLVWMHVSVYRVGVRALRARTYSHFCVWAPRIGEPRRHTGKTKHTECFIKSTYSHCRGLGWEAFSVQGSFQKLDGVLMSAHFQSTAEELLSKLLKPQMLRIGLTMSCRCVDKSSNEPTVNHVLLCRSVMVGNQIC